MASPTNVLSSKGGLAMNRSILVLRAMFAEPFCQADVRQQNGAGGQDKSHRSFSGMEEMMQTKNVALDEAFGLINLQNYKAH